MKSPSRHQEPEPVGDLPSDQPCIRREIARRLRVSTRTIQRWETEHGMPVVRIGKRRRFYIWSQVVDWMVARQQAGVGGPRPT